jgi:Protein of unknown function (DUF3421)
MRVWCLPANVIPRRRLAIGSLWGKKILCSSYDVLIGTGFAWVDCMHGQVPSNAINVFTAEEREELFYMGRVQSNK